MPGLPLNRLPAEQPPKIEIGKLDYEPYMNVRKYTALPETAWVKPDLDTSKLEPESLYAINIADQLIRESGLAAGIPITSTNEFVKERGKDSKHYHDNGFDIGTVASDGTVRLLGDTKDWKALATDIKDTLPSGYDVILLGPNEGYRAHHIHVEWDPKTDEEKKTGFLMKQVAQRPPTPPPTYQIAEPSSTAVSLWDNADSLKDYKAAVEYAEQFKDVDSSTYKALQQRAFDRMADTVPIFDKYVNWHNSIYSSLAGMGSEGMKAIGEGAWAINEMMSYVTLGPGGSFAFHPQSPKHESVNFTEQTMWQLGKSFEKWTEKTFPIDPRLQRSWAHTEAPSAIGSMIGFFGAAIAVGGPFRVGASLVSASFPALATLLRGFAIGVPSALGMA
ncbi:unnamed protein product, partial [marine sediment metagenome]